MIFALRRVHYKASIYRTQTIVKQLLVAQVFAEISLTLNIAEFIDSLIVISPDRSLRNQFSAQPLAQPFLLRT